MKFNGLIILFVLFSTITLLFLSCNENQLAGARLEEAECVMKTAPDSAYAILIHADSSLTFSRSQRAEWNLLTTQAMDKSYKEHTTDSLIREATSYYEQQKNPDRLMLSYYYMGRVYQELGDTPRAQEFYLKALNIRPEKTDHNLLGLINSHLGNLYTRQRVYDEALIYLQQALQYMEQVGNQRGQSFTLRDIGRVYHQQKKMDQSISSYRMALEKATPKSRPSILTELSGCYTEMNQMDSACIYLQEAFACAPDSANYYINSLVLGEFFIKTDKPDSALYYLQLSERSKNVATQAASLLNQIDISRRKQEWKKYADLHARYVILEEIISKQKQTEIIRNAEQLHNYKLAEKDAQLHQAENKLLQMNLIILILIVLILLIVTSVLLFHVKFLQRKYKELKVRHKVKKEQLKEKELKVSEMESVLKETANRMSKILRDKDRFEASLCREEKDKLTKKEADILFMESDISLLFQNNNNPGKISKKDMERLFRKIDTLYPNFRFSIHHIYPKITNKDMLLCYCIKARISNNQTEVVLNCSEDALTSRKYRLLQNLKKQKQEIDSLKSFIDSIY